MMNNSNKTAIMQPTYLPWIGYFELIGNVENFVFLDDVQISVPSWQNRNRILNQNGPIYLTLPTSFKLTQSKLIKDVILMNEIQIKRKHLETIRHSYRKAPYFDEVFSLLQEIYSRSHYYIAQLNIDIIRKISEVLGFHTNFILASDLNFYGSRSEKLIKILNFLNSKYYYSPEGSRDYLVNDGFFAKEQIQVYYQKFTPAPYPQLIMGFTPFLSAIDLFFSLGFEQSSKFILTNKSFVK